MSVAAEELRLSNCENYLELGSRRYRLGPIPDFSRQTPSIDLSLTSEDIDEDGERERARPEPSKSPISTSNTIGRAREDGHSEILRRAAL